MKETELYLPVKKFLEARGYSVKAEVKGCDVLAVKGDEAPVIVELKTGLTLTLFYQAVDRLALTDRVYIAIARPKRSVPSEAVKLTRRLGLGLIVVSKSGSIEIMAEPGPYAPRVNTRRKAIVLKEFTRRHGDPNLGGSNKTKLMTAYKQDALRCLAHLHLNGPTKIAELKKLTNVDRSATILRNDYYGWFTKTARGIYGVTETGVAAVSQFQPEIAALHKP